MGPFWHGCREGRLRHPLSGEVSHFLVKLLSNSTADVMTQGNSYIAPSGDTYSMFTAVHFVVEEWVCKLE